MSARDVSYVVDGVTMVGRLALPEGAGMWPAVLIAHEGNGLDDYQKHRADRLAELGYVAFALDYWGGGKPLDDRDDMMARIAALQQSSERTRALAAAGLNVLLAEPRADASRVAAIGYCFGGTLVLELARTGADLKAVVGFHPGLFTTRPEDSARIVGKVLVCVGAEDPFIPLKDRLAFEEEMRAARVDWRMNLYGGAVHSFTHPGADRLGLPGLAYHQPTAERSWRAMLDLFADVFGTTFPENGGGATTQPR
ncbi:MAG TPA: dienelactone hydrolase family protein [Chloroflexota bacterium]|jgi:dienelactone hydrolase